MRISTVSFTNLNELISVDREKSTSTSLMAGLGIKSGQIYDKMSLTFELSEVNMLELLYLKKVCNTVQYANPQLVDEEQIRSYNLEEELVDSLLERSNFIRRYIEEEEGLEVSYLYDTVMEIAFDVVCVLKGEKLESFLGAQLMNVYRVIADKNTGKRRIMDDTEIEKNLDGIYGTLCNAFFQSLHSGMRAEYEEMDAVIDRHMINEYYNYSEDTSAKLLRVNAPYGASMYFIPRKDGGDGGIKQFQELLPRIIERNLEDEVDLYFVCNSSFWTYTTLLLNYNLHADCCMSRELTLHNTLYADDILLEKYSKRYNKFIGPLLSQRQFLLERTSDRNRPSTTYMMMFAPYNLSITYLLKLGYKDYLHIKDMIEGKIPRDYAMEVGDLETILSTIYNKGKVVENAFKAAYKSLAGGDGGAIPSEE